jgi:tRNA (guanine26-N2/guanine27-N2)-dimethyltransferase
MMELFKEGGTEFYAPEGEATKKLPVFYNPAMEFDRDLSVAILRAFGGGRCLDVLAGTGIRGLRAAKEAGYDIVLNDCSPEAVKLIKKNVARNKISAEIRQQDANLFLRTFKCDKVDAIDIDPFGSFIVAYDSALRAIKRRGGLLLLTATDTAPLCGVSVKTCQRRYDARPIRTSYAKEVGLRILIGACARMTAKYDLSVWPVFSYNHRHYFRLFLKTENGITKANEMLGNISYLQHCFSCDWRGYAKTDWFKEKCPECGGRLDWAGPLWAGGFADVDLCKEILEKTDERNVKKLASMVASEQEVTLPFYDLHHLSELKKIPSPRKADTMGRIRDGGKKATETHLCRTGIRTDSTPFL